jgi:ATP synthase I chain.
MKFSADVKKHILQVSGISLGLSTIMVGVFALLGQFTVSVLWGALCGCFLACFNFFLLAVTVTKALGQEERGKAMASISYMARSLMMLVGGVVAVAYLKFNPIALVIPYIFPRISITIIQMTVAKKETIEIIEEGGESSGG